MVKKTAINTILNYMKEQDERINNSVIIVKCHLHEWSRRLGKYNKGRKQYYVDDITAKV
jgi:hypothetical protein